MDRGAWQASELFHFHLVTKLCLTVLLPHWTVVHQAPLSMGFSRQDYWSGVPFPSPGDLPNPGIEPTSPALAGGFFAALPPGKPSGGMEPISFSCLISLQGEGWRI